MTLPVVACPACGRVFKNGHGRGGHLTTVSDPIHEAYRAAHGLPVKTPRATPAAKRGPPSAPSKLPPSNPAQPSTLPDSRPCAPATRAPGPEDPPRDDVAAFLRQAVDEFLHHAQQPSQTPPTKPKTRSAKTQTAQPSSDTSGPAGVLAGAGVVAGILGLAGLAKSLKGSRPSQSQAPPGTRRSQPAPPRDLPDWISALNGGARMTGGIQPVQKNEWWHL